MARLLNSHCIFENGFFSCNLPEDAVLILKVKTKTRNHTLVEDMEKQTEKFHPWKKLSKDGKQVPQKLPRVLTLRKVDNSVTLLTLDCAPAQQNKNIDPNILMSQIA